MSRFPLRGAIPLCALAALALGCASSRQRYGTADSSTLTSADLRNRTEPIEVLLQRKITGLTVTRNSNGDLVLHVRGSSSYRGDDTPPLYLLNGLPYAPGSGGALIGIDPEDIETIRVLKGPETVIYGIEGANGVIIITTKKGGPSRT